MARFRQTFRVKAPLSQNWAFHDDPRQGLPVLSPPPLRVQVLEIDEPMVKNSRVKFRLVLLGPLGATWHAVYDEFDPYQPGSTQCGFVDRSLSSPFHAWTHRHTFKALPDGSSTVTDDVTFTLIGGPLGGVVTWIVAWPAVVFLFAYRQMTTRRVLSRT